MSCRNDVVILQQLGAFVQCLPAGRRIMIFSIRSLRNMLQLIVQGHQDQIAAVHRPRFCKACHCSENDNEISSACHYVHPHVPLGMNLIG